MNDTSPGSGFGKKLLNHNGLMTPVITRFFGPMRAIQTRFEETQATYYRVSLLYQCAQHNLIIEAKLLASKDNLPAGLIDALRNTDQLFGQLLLDYHISVRIAPPKIRHDNSRWSRQLAMLDKANGKLLCKVDEHLVSDQQLLKHCIIPQESSIK
ncbi:MAG: hypothetical protein JKY31_03060 [Rhodobacteraceae bacterium]|nr:hypothetical protein [Paracoccaceae bacterium]